jgi:uncharacterized membrane protein
MSSKWLKKEIPVWVRQGMITQEQADRLTALYPAGNGGPRILPLLGGILLGLGVLSFVAANWQDIPRLLRFAIIAAAMTCFYAGGERLMRRGDEKPGLGLIAAGLATFGAGIFLIGQMFHIVAYHAGSFVLWGAAGILLAFLYRSGFLFAVTAAILNAGQLYSIGQFSAFSLAAFLVLLGGLGLYWLFDRRPWYAWLYCLSILLQSLLLIMERDWNPVWFMGAVLLLYTAGDALRSRETAFPLQAGALTAAFLFSAVCVALPMQSDWLGFHAGESGQASVYLAATFALLSASAALKWKSGRISGMFEWVLLLPYFYLSRGESLGCMLALCLFSLGVLWRGYIEERPFKINGGTGLFLFSILLAYTKLAWGYMNKSVFFLAGGILLLALSWYLNRRRKQVLTKGGKPHDEVR